MWQGDHLVFPLYLLVRSLSASDKITIIHSTNRCGGAAGWKAKCTNCFILKLFPVLVWLGFTLLKQWWTILWHDRKVWFPNRENSISYLQNVTQSTKVGASRWWLCHKKGITTRFEIVVSNRLVRGRYSTSALECVNKGVECRSCRQEQDQL